MNAQLVHSALLAAVLLVTSALAPVRGDDKPYSRHGERSHGVHQDEVLDALKRNEIRPLAEVIAAAEKAIPGPVIAVKVKRKDGRLVYEIKIIAAEGRVREIYIDAATLETVKIE